MSKRIVVRLSLSLFILIAAAPSFATLEVQGGIRFAAAQNAGVGVELVLLDQGQEVARAVTDTFGSLLFPELEPGDGYVIQRADGSDATPVTVLAFEDTPDPSLYQGQVLREGYQYITTRDGTLLAAMVRAPLGQSLANGPFPTVVEYSGYDAADPDNPQPTTLMATALGYAVVAVNMRGSGCSGGTFDLFDLGTTADGYDVIETVAAQSWVLGARVGMIGISFSGISQLFVGGSRPPHLAAIAPLSVIAHIYRSTGFPGGILNDGFAQSWLQERLDNAEPAPAGGQRWARRRVNQGDRVCLANQRLRLQTRDVIEYIYSHPYHEPLDGERRSPINWVNKIEVPTFFASAWQDEQTGPDFAEMLYRFPRRRDVKISLSNGVHTTAFDPAILFNWLAFLDLYVARRIPDMAILTAIAPFIYDQVLGASAPTPPLPGDRFDGITSYDEALALFESDPYVRVLMENGAGSPVPGLPGHTFEMGFGQWPPREIRAKSYYFGDGGKLLRAKPTTSDGEDAYRPDPEARPEETLPSGADDWAVLPPFDWRPLVDGTAVAYVTDALTRDLTIVGPSSVDLWLDSSADDTDIQVTLSEVRPDGLETYVQSGWLRASHRRLDRKRSSRLEPLPTHLEHHAQLLPPDGFTKVRVGLFAVAHVFRAGSKLRLSLEAPGGDRTRWRFLTPSTGGAVENIVARSRPRPSRVVVGEVPSGDSPEELPPCPSLRGQPCRDYVPAANGG